MSFFLTLGFITPAFNFTAKAEAVEVLNGASTIADIIVTYCAGSGAGITNTTVLGNLYNTVGSRFGTISEFVDDGLLVLDSFGNYIDNGLGEVINAVNWNQIGLDVGNIFSATSENVEAGLAVGTTAGANLASTAGSLAGGGLIGTVASAGGAVVAGIGFGLLINHVREKIAKQISIGQKIDCSQKILDNMYPGGMIYQYNDPNGNISYASIPANCAGCIYIHSGRADTYVCGPNNSKWKAFYNYISNVNIVTINNNNRTGFIFGYTDATWTFPEGNPNTVVQQLLNGTYQRPEVYSPDVIGSNGNQTATYNNGVYDTPDLLPQIDPATQGMQPITQQQWLDFANSANQNTSTSPTPQADNAELFNNFIDNYKIPYNPSVPETDPNPDPNPDSDPETVPVPIINPYPDSYPVADPETVPDNKPQPEYTEKATENETDIREGDPYTTPDLLDKFPFCIPRDILRAFKKLDSGSREAPHIVWRFHPNEMIDYTFDVDFSTWDNVAVLLRTLELIGFIILLGIATRNLILS